MAEMAVGPQVSFPFLNFFFLQEQAVYLELDPTVSVFQVALLQGVGVMLSETFKKFSRRE